MRRVLLVLLLATLALPAASADHVYSHRFVIEGRLLGSDGTPLPGRTVEFFAEGDDFLEPCPFDPGSAVTNTWGDFRFCFHKHELDPQTKVGVSSGNASVRKAMDTAFRRSIVTLWEPNETGTPPEDWNATFLIAGKVWRQGATVLEGVPVFGTALAHAPVNVTLTTGDGDGSSFQVMTDGYGDFEVPLRLLENQTAEEVTVRLETMGHHRSYLLDTRTHRVTVGFILPAADARPVETSFPDAVGTAEAPGSTTPRVSPVLVTLIAFALVGALVQLRRKKK